MNNKDILQRFVFDNAPVRGSLVRLDKSFQTILHQHHYPDSVRKLLGEALVVVNLLSATIKFQGRMTLQFKGKGKLKLLLVQCNHDFHFRGLAQWEGEPTYQELINALKHDPLAITIEPDGVGKQRYQGIVEWQGDSLAESIEGYFRNSEQLPTRLWLAADKSHAVGMLLQIMPQKNSENDEEWQHVIHLTETIKPSELLECDNVTLLHRLYHQEQVRIFEPEAIDFRCTCSVKRSENALLLLGREEAEEELKGHQQIVVTCDFCNAQYIFDAVDVTRIFKEDDAKPQIH